MKKKSIKTYQNSRFNNEINEQAEIDLERFPSAKYIIDNNSKEVGNGYILISKSALLDALISVELEMVTEMQTGTIEGPYSIPAN